MRIPLKHLRRRAACLCLLLSAGICRTQIVPEPDPGAKAAVQDVLLTLARHAEVIFRGQVVSVTRAENAGSVEVRFRIDEAVRGCTSSKFYVLREWAGLWSGRADRYRPGQPFLMLLTSRSSSGLSAPVGGGVGAIPILVREEQPIADAAGLVAPDEGRHSRDATVDLRWIEARRTRRNAAPLSNATPAGTLHPNALSQTKNPAAHTQGGSVPRGAGNDAATYPSLRSVMVLLQAARGVKNARP